DTQIVVEHGRPLRFGKDGSRGLRFDPRTWRLDVVAVGPDGAGEAELLVHDETSRPLAPLLGRLQPPDCPMALGVLYREPATGRTYDAALLAGAAPAGAPLSDLLTGGRTWRVGDGGGDGGSGA